MEYEKQNTKNHRFVKAIGIGMALLIISSGSYYLLNLNDEAGDELKTNNTLVNQTLGTQLHDAGWMLCVREGCGACGTQRVILGTAIRDIIVVDCKEEVHVCYDLKITVVPTWYNVFSNETVLGAQSIEQLNEMVK